jgi:hypothetical protein
METVFHILNRNLPQGTEVWPPASLDINPFHYLTLSPTAPWAPPCPTALGLIGPRKKE